MIHAYGSRGKKSVGDRTFPSNSSKLGVGQSRTHSLSGAAHTLLDHPVHFCINGITVLGWAASRVFAGRIRQN
jgi:hypothetical protein